MEFRLLGPLEVADRDRFPALGGIKQRSLLAVLLLHANEAVAAERLIGELWGETPPATGVKIIQVYVSRLRRELGPERIVTQPSGYVLNVDPAECDLWRFEQLCDRARGADPASDAATLREALSLWRGPALADLAYEPWAQPEIARLEELRVAAVEARIDADLATGRHAVLVAELEALVPRHPFRERLRAQLMLALYRSGRQADALQAYQAARRELADELGLEPTEELKRLERGILQHDPALDVAAERSASTAGDRSLLVVPGAPEGIDALLRLAAPLAGSDPARELIVACVVATADVGAATAALAARRGDLRAAGVAARTAAFSSPAPGDDIARLAAQQNVELLIMDGERAPLDGVRRVVLEQASCDVALLVAGTEGLRPGPVIVPFGAAQHDWAALELGAWVARATNAPLRLIGAATDRRDGRDASRLLADASLIVQRGAGIVAEPLLARPGRRGIVALAEGAGLLIVGLSDRWRQEGLGRVRAQLAKDPPGPTVLVRRGPRPGGLAPSDTRTRFTWSLTGAAR